MSTASATRSKTLDMVYIALFAVLIAICSWISIPATVPFTLQTFGVFVAVGTLGGTKSFRPDLSATWGNWDSGICWFSGRSRHHFGKYGRLYYRISSLCPFYVGNGKGSWEKDLGTCSVHDNWTAHLLCIRDYLVYAGLRKKCG